MARSTKKSWLEGPGDLETAEVKDVPVKGESVMVRGLPAAFSNRASSEALQVKQDGRDQIASVNTERLEVIQFAQGVIEPVFDEDEAQKIAEKYGPAFNKVIAEIDRLSGVDKEALAEASTRFQPGRAGEEGSDVEDGASA